MPSGTEGVSGGTGHPEDRTDGEEHEADDPEDADAEDQSKQQKDQTENDHASDVPASRARHTRFALDVARERRRMRDDRRFSLASAFAAADEDNLAHWVGDFLASRGSDNATLAAGLAQREHWWFGPLRIALDDLVPMAGPDEDVVCPVEPEEWEEEVAPIEELVEEGWEPPPLIAQYRDGTLYLQDGNHRYEALRRTGESEAWVIVWFDDRREHAAFVDRITSDRA